jgi:7-cyano-7-deazaguanine synthase in queuosine biosynthesis
MKIVILYSGGLDSLIMHRYGMKRYPDAEIKCLYYRHGADSEEAEIARLPKFVEVRDVDWLNENCKPVPKRDDPFAGAIYIPGRNLVFSVLAACQELPDEIWMGTLWDEDNSQATDKNEKFRSMTSEVLSYVLKPFIGEVKVRFPFVEKIMTKERAINWALNNGVTKDEIKSTVSCWHHDGMPCGRCKQCFKRYFIFLLNDMEETCRVHPIFSRHGTELLKQYLGCVPKNRDEKNVVSMIRRAEPILPVPLQNKIRDILETERQDRPAPR